MDDKDFLYFIDSDYCNHNPDDYVVMTKEEARKEQEVRDQRRRFLTRNEDFEKYINEYFGNFFFNNYKDLLELLQGDTATIFRYLYICTYSDYNGCLITKGNRPIDRYRLQLYTMLSDRTFTNLLKTLKEKDLLYKSEGKYYVNEKYVKRGTMPKAFEDKSIRVFNKGLQQLYSGSSMRNHKNLGKIIPLLPYVNSYTNVVCHNIYERDFEENIPLTPQEICEVLGYDSSSFNKLRNELCKYDVNGRHIFCCVSHSGTDYYVVNPSVFYHGNNKDDAIVAYKLFSIGGE